MMEWEVLEHPYQHKTKDWYAATIVVAAALAASGIYFDNFLMIVLVIIGTGAFLLLASHEPEMIHVIITTAGVRAGDTLYPYSTLEGFAVIEHHSENKIILESTKTFMPQIVIPVHDDIDLHEVHDMLAAHLPQKELHESAAHLIFERLGF